MLPFLLSFFWVSLSFSQTYPCDSTTGALDIVTQNVRSEDEFYFCFGYHHGKDRAWMMDFFRRSAQGKNAEVLGFDHLKSDLMMRLLDLEGLASKIWNNYPDNEKHKLNAYSRGVNFGFIEGRKAKEFQAAGYEPEDWKPEHSLQVSLLQSFDQTRKTFVTDWKQEKMKSTWKERAALLMENDDPPWENTILKKGEYPSRQTPSQTSSVLRDGKVNLWANFPEVFGVESGSNNWVVSGKKTMTGKAMLANDPHLDLKTPLFLYWIYLRSEKESVMGASIPGVPVVVSGTNGNVAWGITNAYINTADAVFVSDLPKDELETIRPVVWIKIWFLKIPFFFKSFERTKTGFPVLPLEIERDDKMFLKWTGFQLRPSDIIPMFSLPEVKTVDDMDEKLKQAGIPAWNFVFADNNGEIGYRVIGNAYKHEGPTPFGMKTLTYQELQSYVTLAPEERPHVMRPKREYVYSANNRHWPVDSVLNGGRGYSFSFRGNRIDELLSERQSLESFKKIQCDRQAVDAKYFVPKLLKSAKLPELEKWDYDSSELLVAPGIYRRFMDLLMGKWDVNEYGLWRLLDELTESMRSEMLATYQEALKDINNRSWGEVHRLKFAHLSQNKDWVFAPEIGAPGDNHSVDPGTSDWNEDRKVYEHVSGASMRMIIEMEDRPKIHLVLPGFNRDYTTKTEKDPWKDWKDCKYTTFSM